MLFSIRLRSCLLAAETGRYPISAATFCILALSSLLTPFCPVRALCTVTVLTPTWAAISASLTFAICNTSLRSLCLPESFLSARQMFSTVNTVFYTLTK